MEQGYRESRLRRGFTMMELLIVVAIIGILAAIAMPNIAQTKRQLEMAKLDEYARQIYLAAQNEAVKMKASGELEEFYKEVVNNHSEWKLESAPDSYPDTSWQQLYYISSFTPNDSGRSDNPVVLKYFDTAASGLSSYYGSESSFVMEMNLLSGDIYSVFYSENTEAPLTIAKIKSLTSRDRSSRSADKIGYYQGEASNAASALPGEFNPIVTIENGEELRALISCPGMMRISSTRTKLKLVVTVCDEAVDTEGNPVHVWSKTIPGNSLDFVGDTVRTELLLDSYKTDSSGNPQDFASLVNSTLPEGKKLVPGDNITVTAEFIYENDDVTIKGSSLATDNSLFASRTVTDSVCDIKVANIRHLNNLRSSKYIHTKGDTVITQTQGIDNLESISSDGTEHYKFPSFESIDNPSLFAKEGSVKNIYDGQGNTISNLDIKGDGLFKSANNFSFKNIYITDCIVDSSGNYAGTLAGALSRCKVFNCRAYLTTYKNDVQRREDMEARVEKYKVSGNQNVGGLIGSASDSCVVEYSLAAVSVAAKDRTAGGLIGGLSGSELKNCYSSGPVSGNSSGGLIGLANGSRIYDSYTTSNVTGSSSCGGFVGSATDGAHIEGCTSYGQVLKADGSIDPNSGGFVSKGGNGNYANNAFLSQAKYNDDESFLKGIPSGILSKKYQELKYADESGKGNSISSSEPYDSGLWRNPFPFKLITFNQDPITGAASDVPSLMIHYGDWPAELKLQTSLVYYEEYEDGTYGYYAETSLTSATDEGGNASDANKWVVDTLDTTGKTLIEDGYAIMTSFLLEEFTYVLNGAAPKTVTSGDNAGNFTLISRKVSVDFKLKGTDITYAVSNANVFRLPFDLQMTNRSDVQNFYDELKITEGSTNGNKVIENYTFYYCPDFAKNAINPNLNDSTATRPADPDSRPGVNSPTPYIFVRSARQFNGLGRSFYYWNILNNKDREFYFLQEIDLDFKAYKTNYCGVDINLMDTRNSNPYRNRPIGMTNNDTGANFRFVYDGNGKQIIDYCCEAGNNKERFVGMFGEIQYATLKNIHMVASDPANGSGYVKSVSNFNSANVPGLGALVGLVYVDPKDEASKPIATVENCSVSGYRVTYAPDGKTESGVAVGGLAGYNFGIIENCSAVNKVTEITAQKSGDKKLFLGGLVGSLEGDGSIKNCYAGGDLRLTFVPADKEWTLDWPFYRYPVPDSSVGGVCGGHLGIWGKDWNKNKAELSNCYSYCSFKPKNEENKENFSTPQNLYTIAKKDFVLSNTYYLNDLIDTTLPVSITQNSQKCTVDDMVMLTNTDLPGFGWAPSENSNPWPEDTELQGQAYPFPAILKKINEDGSKSDEYVHYGSWPTEAKAIDRTPGGYLCYYERYQDDTYGFYYFKDNAVTATDTLDRDRINPKEIMEARYGILCTKSKDFHLNHANGTESDNYTHTITGAMALNDNPVSDRDFDGLYLYDFKSEGKKEDDYPNYLTLGYNDQVYCSVGISYRTKEGEEIEQALHVNPLYAASIKKADSMETNSNNAEIRTAKQLQAISSKNKDWSFIQTHYILADTSKDTATGNINNNAGGFSYDGQGYEIRNLIKTLFDTTGGTVKSVILTNVSIKRNDAAFAFAKVNNGLITNCSVSGTIESTGDKAAGFVLNNYGEIKDSHISSSDSSSDSSSKIYSNNDAAGFAMENTNLIANCSVSGTIESTKNRTVGFVFTNSGEIKGSHVSGEVESDKDAAGFVMTQGGGSITDSFVHCNVESDEGSACGFINNLNGGNIANSFMVGTVSAKKNAAGFAYITTQKINNCYVNSTIESEEESAAGFVLIQNGKKEETISNCYTVGSVTGNISAAGFFNPSGIGASTWSASNCYSLMKVNSNKNSGFGSQLWGDPISNCFWVSQGDFNFNVSDNTSASKISFDSLVSEKTINDLNNNQQPPEGQTSVWTFDDSYGSIPTEPDLQGKSYPYPRLNLPHYGDWPIASDYSVPEAFGVFTVHTEFGRPEEIWGSQISVTDSGIYDNPITGEAPWNRTNMYGLLFPSNLDMTGWSAKYYATYFDTQEIENTISLTDLTEDYSFTNFKNGYKICRFNLPSSTMKKIVLTAADQTSYIFKYTEKNNTFFYEGTE